MLMNPSPRILRPALLLPLLTTLLLTTGPALAITQLPEEWKPEVRELNLHENPPAAQKEVRVTEGVLTSLEVDDPLDLERTTLTGAKGRIQVSQQGRYLLLLTVTGSLEPGERLPLSVAFEDGSSVELTLVRGHQAGDIRIKLHRRPPPSPEESKNMLAKTLADFALDYEADILSQGRLDCEPQEQETPRIGAEPGAVVYHCKPVSTCGPPKMPSFLHRREPMGKLTINGVESGGIALGMLANGVAYQSELQTVLIVSMFNVDTKHHWRLGEHALRREATGETVPLRFVRAAVAEDGENSSPYGLMAFVIDTPPSPTERFVLEALEKDGGSRRIRVEGMTFEPPTKP
jgi:hypothetical protein